MRTSHCVIEGCSAVSTTLDRTNRHRPRFQRGNPEESRESVSGISLLPQAAPPSDGRFAAASAGGRGLRPLPNERSRTENVRSAQRRPRSHPGRPPGAGHFHCGTVRGDSTQPSRVRYAGFRPPLTAACCRLRHPCPRMSDHPSNPAAERHIRGRPVNILGYSIT